MLSSSNQSVNKTARMLDYAEASCVARGARLTEKRKFVLAGLLQSQKALSAYELIEYLQKEFGKTLPPITVYRILNFLTQEHFVHKLYLANKYVACSQPNCNHTHDAPQLLICEKCGNVKESEIHENLINTLKRNAEEEGYVLNSPQLELHCLCPNCAHQQLNNPDTEPM